MSQIPTGRGNAVLARRALGKQLLKNSSIGADVICSNPTPIVPSTAISNDPQDEFTAAKQDGDWHWSKKHQKYYRFDKVNNKWIFQ
jgi:hypothetical protein